MEHDQLTLEAWWMNTSENKKELKVRIRRKTKEKNTRKLVMFEKFQKAQPGCARTKAYVGAGA